MGDRTSDWRRAKCNRLSEHVMIVVVPLTLTGGYVGKCQVTDVLPGYMCHPPVLTHELTPVFGMLNLAQLDVHVLPGERTMLHEYRLSDLL